MPMFSYKVKDRKGKTLRGTLLTGNREKLLTSLWDEGYYILNIRKIGDGGGKLLFQRGKGFLFYRKVDAQALMFFCRQLSAMLTAGMTVLSSLYILEKEAENLQIKEAIAKMIGKLEEGSTLTEVFAENPRVFPPLVSHMVEGGETGGFVDKVLDRLGDHFQRDHDFQEKVKSAVTYPALILLASFLVIGFLVIKVLPTFNQIFSGMDLELPLFTRILIGLGEYFPLYGPFLLSGFLVLTLLLSRYIRTYKGKVLWDTIIFNLPLYGKLYQKILLARFTRILGTLHESGVGLLFSLELLENITGNSLLNQALSRTREAVSRGHGLADSLAESHLFPHIILAMIKVGENTGQLHGMLLQGAQFLEAEVEYILERLATIIEPVLIIFMAFIVGGIALSVLVPMFEIFQNIG